MSKLVELGGYAAAKAIPGLITFFSIPFVLHSFGPVEYGTFSRIWAASTVTSALGSGWIRQAILRNSGRQTHGMRELPMLIMALAMVAGAIPVAGYALWDARQRTMLAGVLEVGLASAMTLTWGLYSVKLASSQRNGNVMRYNLAELTRTALSLGLAALLGSSTPAGSVEWLLGLGATGNIAGLAFLWREDYQQGAKPSLRVAKNYWHYGWPMSLWLGVSTLTLYSDRFIVEIVIGGAAAGAYAAISDLVIRGIGMLSFPVSMTAHPQIMSAFNRGRFNEAARLVRSWGRILLSISICLAVVALVVAPYALRFVVSNATVGSLTLAALVLSGALWQYAQLAHKYHELANRTRMMLRHMVVSWCFGAAVGLILCHRFGPVGAAAGTLTGTCAYLGQILASRRPLAKSLHLW